MKAAGAFLGRPRELRHARQHAGDMLQRSSGTVVPDFNSASVDDANAGDSAGWGRRHMRGVHTEAHLAASLRSAVVRSCRLEEADSARSLASFAQTRRLLRLAVWHSPLRVFSWVPSGS
jgi:hypothetical protein